MDKIFSPTKERISNYLDYKGIKKDDFFSSTGISASNFKGKGAQSELGGDKLAKILTIYNDINADWLLTGRGSMLREEQQLEDKPEPVKSPQIQILHHPKVSEKKITQQSIPLYDVSVAANLKTVFDNKDQNILGEISMPDIPRCDGAVYVRGDSMYPLLKSGDIVGYKEIHDFSNVIYGEMYIVAYDIEGDEYVCVKYINRSEQDGCVKLVSYNPHHDPKDIQVTRITAMALVKFSIRMNTII